MACSGDAKRARVAGIRGESLELTTLPEGAEFYLTDHQWSPLVRVDASGSVVSSTAYHPYGHILHQTGATGDPFSFVSNEADRGTGISDSHARPYRPELGVFLAVDPVALLTAEKQLQQPAHLGAYLYAAGNPIGLSDPDGLEPTRMQRILAKANHVVASIISDAVCMTLGGCGNANAPRANETVHNAPTNGEVALNIVAAHVAPRVSGAVMGRLAKRGARTTVATKEATAPTAKFSEYIFKEGATHGKDAVFRGLGYSREHSALLAEMWERQATAKFAKKEYTLGKLDQYGQRISIEIRVPGIGEAAGRVSHMQSGWMIQPGGGIKLNTPFSGFTR